MAAEIIRGDAFVAYAQVTLREKKKAIWDQLKEESFGACDTLGIPIKINYKLSGGPEPDICVVFQPRTTHPGANPVVLTGTVDREDELLPLFDRFAKPKSMEAYHAILAELQDIHTHWDEYWREGYLPPSTV
jgi:hypothetical protein